MVGVAAVIVVGVAIVVAVACLVPFGQPFAYVVVVVGAGFVGELAKVTEKAKATIAVAATETFAG